MWIICVKFSIVADQRYGWHIQIPRDAASNGSLEEFVKIFLRQNDMNATSSRHLDVVIIRVRITSAFDDRIQIKMSFVQGYLIICILRLQVWPSLIGNRIWWQTKSIYLNLNDISN